MTRSIRHSRAGGNPAPTSYFNQITRWIPACAGMTTLVISGLALTDTAIAGNISAAVHHEWSAPRAADFVRASAQLAPAIQAVCDAPADKAEPAMQQARRHWLATLTDWERLSAVAFGPVLERRSQRQIDFTPTRPRLIEKAVKTAPATAADMELIGTPAKGLPALEWLLWVKPIQPASAECRYAVQVAAEIGREAAALAAATPASVNAQAALSELVNQWIGGLERLRWANMEMPARVALTSGGKENPDFPRRHAGASAASWAAEWDALRSLASGPVGLESALRERGQNKAADTLAQAVRQADASMQGLNTNDTPRILAVAKQLAALKRLVEAEVAPALGVNLGFSDADGD
jgi:uncharacterized protein